MKIGVVGASGYSGGELLSLLLKHPDFEIEYIAAGSQAGSSISSVHPQLAPLTGQNFEATDVRRMNNCDLIFFALPHGESDRFIAEINSEIKVLLSSGYSLNEEVQAIMNRGCNGFLQKPFQLEIFSRKLREMLD